MSCPRGGRLGFFGRGDYHLENAHALDYKFLYDQPFATLEFHSVSISDVGYLSLAEDHFFLFRICYFIIK